MGGQVRGHVIWKWEVNNQVPGAQKVGKPTDVELNCNCAPGGKPAYPGEHRIQEQRHSGDVCGESDVNREPLYS